MNDSRPESVVTRVRVVRHISAETVHSVVPENVNNILSVARCFFVSIGPANTVTPVTRASSVLLLSVLFGDYSKGIKAKEKKKKTQRRPYSKTKIIVQRRGVAYATSA